MLLVFSPVPYVDASSAWGFKDKRKRMVVGGIGIAVELFLGALALFVWLMVEPGAVRAVAYNVMLISGVSTLLFNGNPLLRFDGYYVLADAIEMPNLGARSNTYLGYLFQRYVLGIKDGREPGAFHGERAWMVVYGITSFFYRIFISFIIITFIAGKFFVIGILLAIWAMATQVLMPVGKSMSFLFKARMCSASAGVRWSPRWPCCWWRRLLFMVPAELDTHRGRGLGARRGAGARRCRRLPGQPAGGAGQRGAQGPAADPGRGALSGHPRRRARVPADGTECQVRFALVHDRPGAGRHGARGDHRRARPTCKRAASGSAAWCSAVRPMAASSCPTPTTCPVVSSPRASWSGMWWSPRS
jgi:hypothetical protein